MIKDIFYLILIIVFFATAKQIAIELDLMHELKTLKIENIKLDIQIKTRLLELEELSPQD